MPHFKELKRRRNMSNNTELKILDELLRYLLKTDFRTFKSIRNDTFDNYIFFKTVDNYTLEVALLKLAKDEYVIETNKDINNPQKSHYHISFEGMFFIKNGGYGQALLEVQRKENEYDDLKTEQKKQAISLLRLNRWLVFGAIVVAIDSILNIFHFFGVYFDTSNLLFCVKPT